MITKTLLTFLTSWIISNTEFNQEVDPPPFFQLSKKEMSDKACYSSENCRLEYLYKQWLYTSFVGSPPNF